MYEPSTYMNNLNLLEFTACLFMSHESCVMNTLLEIHSQHYYNC